MLPHITIRLVGQQNDRLWELIKVDPEIHVEELVNLIQTLTRIPPNFQQIEFRGERLPTVEHPLQTIKFGEELVVSHNHLIYWKTFLEMIEEIRKMTTSGATSARREIADRAQEQLAILRYSKFFHVYSSLSFEELKISCNLNFLVYNTKKYLDRSVLAYFEALYPKRKVELKDKTKNFAGIHLGVFVLVDGVASHYAKTLGDIPGIEEDINCIMIDSIEIFVYILLKLIGLGAEEVHVIPEVNKDEWVFIATKLSGFDF
uniref:Ubiquitin-like domain-containing protein n=1 Tax=Caenorhabditis tropicalis TaxID=1561998 RepID=A0A1I7UC23_9PELO